jgi:hypothetical protein
MPIAKPASLVPTHKEGAALGIGPACSVRCDRLAYSRTWFCSGQSAMSILYLEWALCA